MAPTVGRAVVVVVAAVVGALMERTLTTRRLYHRGACGGRVGRGNRTRGGGGGKGRGADMRNGNRVLLPIVLAMKILDII